jgi:hypothetical protein
MQPEIVVPVVASVALLWWIGRALSPRAMLIATIGTLIVIVLVVYAQRGGGG